MSKVLVIDDDTEVRQLICRMLQKGGGYETVEAQGGRAGIDAFERGRFTAVVTDLVMPSPTGIETIARLRALDPDVPIVAVSGFGWDDSFQVIRDALSAGANRTLGKPFRPEELLSVIRELTASQGDGTTRVEHERD
jgi:CheY-like chemotaxis protein